MAWIEEGRVVLRAWEREDIAAFWEASQSVDASGERLRDWHEPPRSLYEREQDFESFQHEADPTVVRMIIQADGQAIGDIDLFHVDARNRNTLVGLGIWRAEDRGKGFGTDAMRAMLRWAFRHLNMRRVELSVEPENEPAVRLYKKLGFVVEGCRREHHYDDGCYHDELIMAVLRREFEVLDHSAAP